MINLKSIVVAGLLALGVAAAFAQSCKQGEVVRCEKQGSTTVCRCSYF